MRMGRITVWRVCGVGVMYEGRRQGGQSVLTAPPVGLSTNAPQPLPPSPKRTDPERGGPQANQTKAPFLPSDGI